MKKRYLKLAIQTMIIFVIYFMFSPYIDGLILIVILIAVAFFVSGVKHTGRKTYLSRLEVLCDAPQFIDYIEKKLEDKDESFVHLYRAYGNLFTGDFTRIQDDINKVDVSILKKDERFMYEEVKLKILYNNEDASAYQAKLIEVTNGEFNESHSNELLILKAPLYLMKKQYKELIDLMFKIIPIQKKKHRIMELEYYLAVAYEAIGKNEDAVAVLELVTKRDFKLIYTVKGNELLNKIQSN